MRITAMSRAGSRRALLRCGAAAGPLFVSVFLIEGARRPGYKPLRHPVSSLALGPRGWLQAANFAATGMLYLAGAAGLARSPDPAARSRIAAAALGATGLGLLGSAVFRTTQSVAIRQERPTLPPRPRQREPSTPSPPCPSSSAFRQRRPPAPGKAPATAGQAGPPTRPRQPRQCWPAWD
jgi:hypothetical protein